jgi:hypothetical protein
MGAQAVSGGDKFIAGAVGEAAKEFDSDQNGFALGAGSDEFEEEFLV